MIPFYKSIILIVLHVCTYIRNTRNFVSFDGIIVFYFFEAIFVSPRSKKTTRFRCTAEIIIFLMFKLFSFSAENETKAEASFSFSPKNPF